MLSLADRTKSLTPSYTIGISMQVAELREQGKHILRQLLVLKQLRKGILHISLHVMT